MAYKKMIRRALERFAGVQLYRTPPRGADYVCDIRKYLPGTAISTIFDVGANVGQSARAYLRCFPAARIYCFEPIGDTYRKLQRELSGEANVQALNIGFAAAAGARRMIVDGRSDMSRLQAQDDDVGLSGETLEAVDLRTIDGFCGDQDVASISFLKIDTEGADLEVLKGAEGMLSRQAIDIVQVEAGMNPRNERHVAFSEFTTFMEVRDYYLFGVYEQVNEWPTGAPNLRRTNPIFVSDRVVRANTLPLGTG